MLPVWFNSSNMSFTVQSVRKLCLSSTLCKSILIIGLLFYMIFISLRFTFTPVPIFFCPFNKSQTISSVISSTTNDSSQPCKSTSSPTGLNHLVFGLLGAEKTWHHRKAYIEAWWRPEQCRGFLYLDKPPVGEFLPWSNASPPYRVSENLTKLLEETKALNSVQIRIVHGIMETFKEVEHEKFRWLVMGDDDSIFFIENMVDVLREYDHRKYYYFGGSSEFILANYWFRFNQAFGGGGIILSYPLAKILVANLENCIRRYAEYLNSSDQLTMACIADFGVNLSPHNGFHQIDLRGDISGLLSSHPKSPLLSLHHLDLVEPLFPAMDRFESTRHLMKAARVDESRMLQQTICHYRQNTGWTFSISWGYSAHMYEVILPRSFLQNPIETFTRWASIPRDPPHYMFNTRLPSNDPIGNPRVFFFQKVKNTSEGILTTYSRASSGNTSVDLISKIHVLSPTTKRAQMERCECCDVVSVDGSTAKLKFRECMLNEIIA